MLAALSVQEAAKFCAVSRTRYRRWLTDRTPSVGGVRLMLFERAAATAPLPVVGIAGT